MAASGRASVPAWSAGRISWPPCATAGTPASCRWRRITRYLLMVWRARPASRWKRYGSFATAPEWRYERAAARRRRSRREHLALPRTGDPRHRLRAGGRLRRRGAARPGGGGAAGLPAPPVARRAAGGGGRTRLHPG